MARPCILHMFTPGRQASPFDVNMAIDAGFDHVVPYAEVGPANVAAMTQDAIFSRGPKGVANTGIFIGGRDVMVAADMLDLARQSMVPPFAVSVFADPSGSYTTAAALVASVERQLRKAHGSDFTGKRVLVLGGSGAVGRVAGALASQLGARVWLSNRVDDEQAVRTSQETNARFQAQTQGILIRTTEALRAALAEADIVFATASAGVQVMSEADRDAAGRLLVAADVNAVPPAGIAGVEVMDDGKRIGTAAAVGVGALAIGNIKYQVQHRLFLAMREATTPVYLGFPEAMAMARAVAAELP
ncbi:NAD(P)-dependent methylenetetrahydromethanopterin dehydrogenase [Cupriavidus oxalaticus]|uniref:Methylenetetrahydromethanopterin dehydrogenase n=1 Tax=Cupriavidus oxalaticus TaxID=96344 RepID=A0A4P7LLB5_9BURK|nr:NAD(P)-dependent methylenetetrahydromethanopterin dehydrogenase [Cupriavidus oxalaticus]QBY55609.1 methylenetetrahydromethanopterin dehydrogenase [Cupriavidus oxalaticus]